jgi:outer membrane protein assembly factor BamE (lipoprotein component of BamABCDE complex)
MNRTWNQTLCQTLYKPLNKTLNESLGLMRSIATLIALPLILSGCYAISHSSEDAHRRNSNLTHGMVQTSIHVGSTTQAQILETFGAPNITTVDSSGQEVWSYQRAATVTQSSSQASYFTILIAGRSRASSGFERSSRMITLIIKFNSDKIVSDFRSRSSQF